MSQYAVLDLSDFTNDFAEIKLIVAQGTIVRTYSEAIDQLTIERKDLSDGVYSLILQSGNNFRTLKLVIQ